MPGCGCSSDPVPVAPASSGGPASSPCGTGAYVTEVIWDPLSLAGSTTVVSPPVPTRGGNAFDFILVAINSASTYQTVVQAQVSSDGKNWTNAGSAAQILAVGYSTSSAITGNSFAWIRFVAVNQVANLTMFSLVTRIYC